MLETIIAVSVVFIAIFLFLILVGLIYAFCWMRNGCDHFEKTGKTTWSKTRKYGKRHMHNVQSKLNNMSSILTSLDQMVLNAIALFNNSSTSASVDIKPP